MTAMPSRSFLFIYLFFTEDDLMSLQENEKGVIKNINNRYFSLDISSSGSLAWRKLKMT